MSRATRRATSVGDSGRITIPPRRRSSVSCSGMLCPCVTSRARSRSLLAGARRSRARGCRAPAEPRQLGHVPTSTTRSTKMPGVTTASGSSSPSSTNCRTWTTVSAAAAGRAHPLAEGALRDEFQLDLAGAPELLEPHRAGRAGVGADDPADPLLADQRRDVGLPAAGVVGHHREVPGTLLQQGVHQLDGDAGVAEAPDEHGGTVGDVGDGLRERGHPLVDHEPPWWRRYQRGEVDGGGVRAARTTRTSGPVVSRLSDNAAANSSPKPSTARAGTPKDSARATKSGVARSTPRVGTPECTWSNRSIP